MSNSPLVNYVRISPNSNNPRNDKIQKITIHHVAGNLTVEQIGAIFAPVKRQASSNYGVDNKGRIGMYVEEKNRSWCSSNADNDHQAITIEVANISGAPDWKVSDIALEKTIDLCVDICKRNGIDKINFTGDKTGNLTMHKWFAATACPGPYLESKFPYIADEINKRLNAQVPDSVDFYRVQTGAFKIKNNAIAYANEIKSKGFDTYIVQADGYYKVQVGAYAVKTNADRMAAQLKGAGYPVFITTKAGTAVNLDSTVTTPVKRIQVGSKVKIVKGAKSYAGQTLASFVYNNVYTVMELKGDRVVIGQNGVVTAAVKYSDLILQD